MSFRTLVVSLLLLGTAAPAPAQDQVTATMLLYQRQDGGGSAYPSRVLVTADHMRLDHGEDDGDFILFDRRARTIHSVTHGEGSVLDIRAREVSVEPPTTLHYGEQRIDGGDLPEVGGIRPEHYRLSVNGERCYDVVAVPGLLEDAVAARREYRQVLAGEHARTVKQVPADIRNACDMATHTFAPNRHLRHGLPIQERMVGGFSQVLVDYDPQRAVDAALFRLPPDYHHYTTDAIGGG